MLEPLAALDVAKVPGLCDRSPRGAHRTDEGRVCLEEILTRYPHFELDEKGAIRAHSGNVRGFVRLPVRFYA